MGMLQNKEGERPAKAPPLKSHLEFSKVGENAIGDFISHFSLIVKWLFIATGLMLGDPADLWERAGNANTQGHGFFYKPGSFTGGEAGESPERSARVVCMAAR
jgi:hypothetical protein